MNVTSDTISNHYKPLFKGFEPKYNSLQKEKRTNGGTQCNN